VRVQLVSGVWAQVTQSAAPVAIVLVLRPQLALAGAVVAALSLAAAIGRPIQGRVIDRRGAGGVTALCGVVHLAALTAIAGAAGTGAPAVALVALGTLAGLALPPISTNERIVWASLVPERERTAVYSLTYLGQQLALLTGPLLLAVFVSAGSARIALVVVAAAAAAGTLAFAASLHAGAPPPAPLTAPAPAVLRVRGMQLVLVVGALVGAVIGGLDIAAPTLATAHRAPAAAGLLIASLSIGGITGAALYGGRRWAWGPLPRLLAILAMLTLALLPTIAESSLFVVGALLALAGIALNPALSTFSLLVDRHVPPRTAGLAFGWLSTAIAGGTGAASAVAAALAQRHHDASAAFAVAALAAAGALLVAVAARRRLAGVVPSAR
jgi:MFS family permease